MTFIKNFIAEENGADMVEYALLIGLVALGALVALTSVGTELSSGFTNIKGKVNTNVTTK